MNSSRLNMLVVAAILVTSGGCASSHVRMPATRTSYTVSAEGSGEMQGVETVELRGNWVILDGRRLIPREKIHYIRADREKPSELRAKQ